MVVLCYGVTIILFSVIITKKDELSIYTKVNTFKVLTYSQGIS